MLCGLYFVQQSSQTKILASEQFMDEESGTHSQNVLIKICPCLITNLGHIVPKVFQHVVNLRNVSYIGQRDYDRTQKNSTCLRCFIMIFIK